MMKKLLATIICCLITLTASAQWASSNNSGSGTNTSQGKGKVTKEDTKRVRFGIRGNMNFCSMKSDYTESCFGTNIGAIMDLALKKRFVYLQPGIYYSLKSYKYNHSIKLDRDDRGESVLMHSVEIPILLSARARLAKKAQIQFNVGPYIAFGSFNDDAFDAGVSAGFGFAFGKHFYLGFEAEIGLVDIDCAETEEYYNYSWSKGYYYDYIDGKTRNYMISLGWNF